jgi:hypothetical protein
MNGINGHVLPLGEGFIKINSEVRNMVAITAIVKVKKFVYRKLALPVAGYNS